MWERALWLRSSRSAWRRWGIRCVVVVVIIRVCFRPGFQRTIALADNNGDVNTNECMMSSTVRIRRAYLYIYPLVCACMQVGLLDIDLCGPSIPRMLGLQGSDIHSSALGWEPVYVSDSLGVMSIGFMLPEEDEAVIWRGPRKNGKGRVWRRSSLL